MDVAVIIVSQIDDDLNVILRERIAADECAAASSAVDPRLAANPTATRRAGRHQAVPARSGPAAGRESG